ncbi:MAG: hypothetical protein KDE53_00065, partial [Caldilineaceae bacterium]|nr:hypothetical protein [Caldilineaceae bacterium]
TTLPHPSSAAVSAALAVLIAGAGGALSSIWLRYRWQLPGNVRRPWLVCALVLVLALIALYLPVFWLWRIGLALCVFALFAWFGGLFHQQDWALLQRVLRRAPN